ncbi:MAG: bifunctional metallophosphatase/5'-nucleotidase [Oligosphaeraceae bacterium]|nr:bifunctional metallophosphatase/5'-nucleotidase [Oligosphaeraceae bacterium]
MIAFNNDMKSFCHLFLPIFLLNVLLFAEQRRVYFLQTTDIHSVLVEEEQEPSYGSFLRLGTLIREQRNRLGAERCLLIDCGDTIQGTLIAALSGGEVGTAALRALDYDVWVPGNHEFDFGLERFLELAEPMRPILLCGNLRAYDSPPFQAWRIEERNGVRIALIGMTASYMRYWLGEGFGAACMVEYAKTSLKRIFPDLLAVKPDMIVLAIHQAWEGREDPRQVNEVADIVEQFPEIDLVLGGHTHRSLPGHRIGPRSWYVQAGFAAKQLGLIEALVDIENHRVLEINSQLLELPPHYEEDPDMRRKLQPWLEMLDEARSKSIAPAPASDILSKGRPGINCQASELFCMAIAEASKADIVLHGVLSKKNFPAKVAISEQDIFDFVPYENNIITAYLNQEELKEVILEQWNNRSSYTYSGVYGIKLKISESEQSVEFKDPEIGQKLDQRSLKLALNSFTAAGSGRYPKLRAILLQKSSKRQDSGISSRDAVRDYLQKHPGLKVKAQAWMQISK